VIAALDRRGLTKRRDRANATLHAALMDWAVVVPLSMIVVATANPRSRTASSSPSANVVSAAFAVSTVHAIGSPVRVSTAAWTL
jgi:hypothetical protein